eukprot:gene2918-biopygen1639
MGNDCFSFMVKLGDVLMILKHPEDVPRRNGCCTRSLNIISSFKLCIAIPAAQMACQRALLLLLPLFRHAAGPTAAMRVNPPVVPFALQPLRWGAVSPLGWLRDWAVAGRNQGDH